MVKSQSEKLKIISDTLQSESKKLKIISDNIKPPQNKLCTSKEESIEHGKVIFSTHVIDNETSQLWNKLETPNSNPHIKDTDICLYAREYLSGNKNMSFSQLNETNRLIVNLKKSPEKKTKPKEWWHREQAVTKFKTETEQLFRETFNIAITAIPSSKHKDHSEYDNRFEDLFKELLKSWPNLTIEWPIEIKETVTATHFEENRKLPKDIKDNYIWKGFKKSPEKLFVFDDVLTSGAHFRAVSDFLKENEYKGQIIGIFWAKTKPTKTET